MTFATEADVEARLLRALTPTEGAYVGRLLTHADGLITSYLPGVSFDGTTAGATVSVRGNGTDELWLPARPVTSVTSVTIDGAVLDPGSYVTSTWGPLRRLFGYWSPNQVIDVTWDHGLAEPPPAVVSVAADIVKWMLINPTNSRQLTVGQYSESFAAESLGGTELTAAHRRTLDRYKPKITSVLLQSMNPWWGHGD